MNHRKLNKRGSILIEYIIILCFMAGLSVSFIVDGLKQPVIDAMTNVKQALSVALGYAESGGKYPLKVAAEDEEIFRKPLTLQTEIMYNTLSELLGHPIAGVSLNMDGAVTAVWYAEDDQLIKIDDATTIKAFNDALDPVYEAGMRNKDDEAKKTTWSAHIQNRGPADMTEMFVAYDQYGNVVQSIPTEGLSIADGDNVAEKQTIMCLNNWVNNSYYTDVTVLEFDPVNGFTSVEQSNSNTNTGSNNSNWPGNSNQGGPGENWNH